jgi:predicted short-subunit dehydrogenase-like oxidoreductase (DUF2520 family)
MAEISIIGAGRLGTSLGRALARKRHHIRALACRRLSSAKESRGIIGQGEPLTDLAATAGRGEVIFLCLPDEEISRAAGRLARTKIDWRGRTVFHTSGLLSSEVLRPLREKGAAVGSFHPAQSFPSKRTPPSRFRGVSFSLEGDRKALILARRLARQLGGHPLVLSAQTKAIYHAACIMASNYLVVLWQAAAELLGQAGIPVRQASRLLGPLVEGTLRNVKKLDAAGALTGPVVRGDLVPIKTHLEALGRCAPRYSRVYREIGRLALEIAKGRGLPARKVRALKQLLADK